MKKNIIYFVLFGLVTNGCLASPQKQIKKYSQKKSETTKMTILQNGVIRDIYLSNKGNKKATNTLKREGVIIQFMDQSKIDIKYFETTYGLKLKEKMVIGYYIFDNKSEKSDNDLVSDIILGESNIKTVKPNWKMNNQTR